MDEHPHFFYPSLAEHLGLNEAIVLQQIHGWFQTYAKDPDTYKRQHWREGAWWIWNSYPEWHKAIPYLSEHTIRRTLVNLREQGLLKTANHNYLKIDRTLWYTIDYEAYDKFWADQETKMDRPSVQNGQMEMPKMDRPLPDSSSDSSSDFSTHGGASAPEGDGWSWQEELFEAGEEEQENPAEVRKREMRARLGQTYGEAILRSREARSREGEWTVPHYRDLSPQCAVYRRVYEFSPKKYQRKTIDECVATDQESLQFWEEVCQAWANLGWSPTNIEGQLKFYVLGQVPCIQPRGGNGRHDRPNGGQKEQAQQEKIEAAISTLFDETGRRRSL